VANKIVSCQRCGAPIEVPDDARHYACRFCGAEVLVAVDAQQIAAGMKLDLSNAATFLGQVAHAVETALPDSIRVQRQGPEVAALDITLGADLFHAHREAHGLVAQHKHMVRGIALKTATLPVDRWADLLLKTLATFTNDNAKASQALASFFGRR
jgi:DNA-directed RNA polymerase subunit RPC12/RpoP